MPFERPAPDLTKIIAAWQEFERGEETPGKVLANMKMAGLTDVFDQPVIFARLFRPETKGSPPGRQKRGCTGGR